MHEDDTPRPDPAGPDPAPPIATPPREPSPPQPPSPLHVPDEENPLIDKPAARSRRWSDPLDDIASVGDAPIRWHTRASPSHARESP